MIVLTPITLSNCPSSQSFKPLNEIIRDIVKDEMKDYIVVVDESMDDKQNNNE